MKTFEALLIIIPSSALLFIVMFFGIGYIVDEETRFKINNRIKKLNPITILNHLMMNKTAALKASKFLLLPTIVSLLIGMLVTISITTPIQFFLANTAWAITFRVILLIVEVIVFIKAYEYYEQKEKVETITRNVKAIARDIPKETGLSFIGHSKGNTDIALAIPSISWSDKIEIYSTELGNLFVIKVIKDKE